MPTARRLMITQVKASPCKPEKNVGWWTVPGAICIGAWQAVGATDFSTSLIDLAGASFMDKRPTITVPPVTTTVLNPTWDAVTGWKFPKYGRLDAMDNIITGSYTIVFRYSGATSISGIKLFGVGSSSKSGMAISIRAYGHSLAWYFNKSSTIPHAGGTNGILGIAGSRPIMDKLVIPNVSTPLSKVVAHGLHIGTSVNRQSAAANNIQAFAIYCSILTQAETDTLGDRMLAL